MEESSVAQIIESSWEKVEAHIALEDVMASFLTQSLDQCGATICLAAFQLVSRVLDKGGYVRRIHKSENTPLSGVLANPEGPWVEQNKRVDRHWDYTGTWTKNMESISKKAHESPKDSQKYYPLKREVVFKRFCEPVRTGARSGGLKDKIVKPEKRSERAKFKADTVEIEDPEISWTPLYTSDSKKNDYILESGPSESDFQVRSHEPRLIQRWETQIIDDIRDKSTTLNLEPYWMFDMKPKIDWSSEELAKYNYQKESINVFPVQKPDLVMQIVYTCPKHYSQKKIVVMAEIDGEDKTQQTSRTDKNTDKHDFSPHPAKLAMKAMQSTSVQAVLQPHTYNIRSNFYSYLRDTVDRSLFNTTNLEITNFRDILNRLSQSETGGNGLDDLHQLKRTIHLVSHMYKAHIKVAFLIYMREVHGIDMRDGLNDKRVEENTTDRMQDHHFFVNFTGVSLPNEIKFAVGDDKSTPVQKYLRDRLMLQSLVKIKVFDTLRPQNQGKESTSTWAEAPIMSIQRSSMTNWSARVFSGQLPMFPKEGPISVPVTYATIQRVDMKKLCEFVTNAAAKAFLRYDESRTIKPRDDTLRRREFPDRCYLTRREQLNRNMWWNKQLVDPDASTDILNAEKCHKDEYRVPGVAVRSHTKSIDEDLVELNFGYEKPRIIRNYRENPSDMNKCKWDQVDVRMHIFSEEIGDDWKESANGMWYVEDYVQFFRMLQTLQRPRTIEDFKGKKCAFTCQPHHKPSESVPDYLVRAQTSTQYRLRLHDFSKRENEIMESTDLINLFWQSAPEFKNTINLKTFEALLEEMVRLEGTGSENTKPYLDIVESIMDYIINENIIIPILTPSDGKKSELSFFTLDQHQTKKDRLEGTYVGFRRNKHRLPARALIVNIQEYAKAQYIHDNVNLADFFQQFYVQYQREYDERNKATKEYEMVQATQYGLKLALSAWEKKRHSKFKGVQSESNHSFAMPEQSENHDLAYHIFSVLSFFFNCRDDGACRYRWENWLLDYFGESSDDDDPSEFHHFEFDGAAKQTKGASPSPDYEYFNQTWFQMCFFLEHNFRNAISVLHYKLFDMGASNVVGFFSDENGVGLQSVAKRVYNREKSLLNNRSSFAGLGNVSAGLSFRKYNSRTNANLTLRHRILSQMDDELPDLDPALVAYVRKFRIPDSELFLRIIRCPNILALRELAKQHMSPEPRKHMQQVLDYFDPAIQSEIEVMLKFVETDESVYVHAPEAHPSKRLLLTESQLLKWMRQTVKCTSFASSLGMLSNRTPLQCKYDMFLNPASFHVLKDLFCTRNLINFGCQRPLRFILLQLALVDRILRCEDIEDIGHENDSLYLALKDERYEHHSTPVGMTILIKNQGEDERIPCVIGTSRRGWPQRDLNKVSCIATGRAYERENYELAKVYEQTHAKYILQVFQIFKDKGLDIQDNPIPKHQFLTLPEANDEMTDDEMTDDELRLWMLLAYARPCSKPECEINVSITHGVSVDKSKGKGDCEDVVLHYQEEVKHDKRVLSCCIHGTEDHIFFERCEKSSVYDEQSEFPLYVKALIPDNIDRKMIYVPTACAAMLRRQIRSKGMPAAFIHKVQGQGYIWRPMFSGLRTWCWKRLLVKTIFLHSFGKIATRSTLLLSLYKPVKDVNNTDIKNLLREASNATVDKIGDLTYKEKWLPKDCKERNHLSLQKEHAVIISLHEYQARKWTTENDTQSLDTHACLANRAKGKQILWVNYLNENIDALRTTMSCRFLRIEKRLEEPLLSKIAQTSIYKPAVAESFFVYRDYLYFQHEIDSLVVNVNNAHYVKFPSMFAIRTYNVNSKRKICVCKVTEDKLESKKFFTSFDTRRCTWFHKVNLDNEEDTEHMQTYKSMHLSGKNTKDWKTVSDPFQDGLQWACKTDVDTQTKLGQLKPAYNLQGLHEDSCLFTMPDFQLLKTLDDENIDDLCQNSTSPKLEQLNVALQDIKSYEKWMRIKGDSRFLVLRTDKDKTLQELKQSYANSVLKDLMAQISETLKPSSSENMWD